MQRHCIDPSQDSYSMWTIATAGCLSTIASTKAHFYPLMGFELDTNAECRAMQDMHYDLTKVKSSGDFRFTDPKNLRRPKLINSGLPCPDYTPLGSGLDSKGKRGGDCYVQQGRWLRLAGADVLILEQTFFARNVDHGQGPGSDVKELIAELSKDYVVYDKDMDTWRYGDVTSRVRLYIVAIHKRHGEKAHHYKFPEPRFTEDRYPVAADIAVPDSEVPERYWLHGEPVTTYQWREPAPGSLHHLGRYGEKGPGDREWPHNLYSWLALFNTQLTSNGGGRRTALNWKPGEPIKRTRVTVPQETSDAASLSRTYLPWARQFGDGSDDFVRLCINMGEPIQTCYALHESAHAFLEYLGVEHDVMSNKARQSEVAKRQGLKKALEAKQSSPWTNLYKRVRSMLVDTGASGSLSYKDAGKYLVGAKPSAYTIGTANKKGSMNGVLDGTARIMALNTAGYKGIPKEVAHSFETTTVDGLRTELYSMDTPFREGHWNLKLRQPDHESGVSEICKDAINGRPAQSIPLRYDYQGIGGWWLDYVFVPPGSSKMQLEAHHAHLDWAHAQQVEDNSQKNVTNLTRNSYDLDSAGLITQRIVDRPGVTGVTVCKTCDCDEYENWGGQEPVQCGMCCNAAYLDQIPDDGQITDVIEARVPDEKETRGTREQLKNGIAKWSNLKFHRKYGHCGNCGKCEICTMVKGAMKRYHKKVDPHRDTRPWHTVAMDMIQFSHTSLEGNQNMICFRDEATGEYHFEFLYLKSDAPTMIEDFIKTRRADPAYSHMSYPPIQVLVTDEPGEWGLKSAAWKALKQRLAFQSQHCTPETSKEAGRAEVSNKIAEHTIKAIMFEQNLPENHWEACARSALFLLNRFPNLASDVTDPIDGDRASPLEKGTSGKYSRRQIMRELAYFQQAGTLALVHEPKAKGSQLKPKVRWGIAWGMYREQVVFKCPFTSSTFRSKSFTAIELEEGLSCYQFLGLPQPTLSKRRLIRQQPDVAKVDIKLRSPTESRRLPLVPVVTLQSANEYGVVEEKPKCTGGKRTRPGTPSSPDLGGSVRLFDEDGNQLETDGKTGEIKGTILQFSKP